MLAVAEQLSQDGDIVGQYGVGGITHALYKTADTESRSSVAVLSGRLLKETG